MSTSTTPSHSSRREAAASPWPPAAAATALTGTDFKPQKAKSSELGTKWQIFDNRLLLSAALFRTDIEKRSGRQR